MEHLKSTSFRVLTIAAAFLSGGITSTILLSSMGSCMAEPMGIGTVRFVQAEPEEEAEEKSVEPVAKIMERHVAAPAKPAAPASPSSTRVQPKPGPLRLPTLSAPSKIVEGQRVLLRYEYPQSEWRRDDDQADWPAYVRIDDVDYECIHYLAPFADEGHVGFLDLNDGLLTLLGRGRFGTIAWPPGKHRVALVYRDVLLRSPGDPDNPVHYDELVGETIEFEVVYKDSPIAQTLRAGKKYEGKTLDEWLVELGSSKSEARMKAKAALAQIGQPAVARLVQFIEETDPRAGFAANTLAEMGPESREAVPRLLGLVRRHMRLKETASRVYRWPCYHAVQALSKMPWAAAEATPVLRQLVQHATGRDSLSRNAIRALAKLSPEAVPMLRELAEHDSAQIRHWATDILAETLINSGQASRLQFYRKVIERDRFDENVPDFLPELYLGDYSIGPDSKPHPLTQEIKALYRQRLEENPDPQTAWNLARIIQRHLAGTHIEWAVGTNVVSTRWLRVDPAENYVRMADVLERGFQGAEEQSRLWRKLGTALAKVRLLQGDWQGMNAALGQIGEAPIPDEERAWLAAPPTDWTDLRAKWQAAALSMRAGDCSLVLRFEKDGRGLAGTHVLLQAKPRPNPSRVSHTGIRIDSILFSPCPIPRYSSESFGYPAEGKRARTRYAVSDESGMVRFDKLPEMDLHMEVLIPTGNFTEQARDWELLIETQAGRFEKTARLGHPGAIHPHDPEAQLPLKSGTTFDYPKLQVRAKKG